MKSAQTYLFLIVLPLWFFSSCRSTKGIEEGELLLTKNHYHIDNRSVNKDDLVQSTKQKPNRKVLGWRINLFIYNLFNDERLSRKNEKKRVKLDQKNAERIAEGKDIKDYKPVLFARLRKNVGEPPVIVDSNLIDKTEEQLTQYLKNNGYFDAEVKAEIVARKNPKNKQKHRKASVHYTVNAGKAWKIANIQYTIEDTSLVPALKEVGKGRILRTGQNFSVEDIDLERQRLADEMNNLGYYFFTKDYVQFKVDTTRAEYKVYMSEIVRNPIELTSTRNGNDSIIVKQHQQYTIRNVYVNASYNPRFNDMVSDSLYRHGLYFINKSLLLYTPKVLAKSIYIEPDAIYDKSKSSYTYRRLSALGNFKFINIRYEMVTDSLGENILDCIISLTPTTRQTFGLELEGTNTGANLGISGSFSYINRNTFRGAEQFRLSVYGGIEAQPAVGNVPSDSDDGLFNTIEYGIDFSLNIPEILFPKRIFGYERPIVDRPKTNFQGSIGYQLRPDYERFTQSLMYGYSWLKPSNRLRDKRNAVEYNVFPINTSITDIDNQPWFQDWLDQSNNAYLKNTYTDHFILGSRFNWTFTNRVDRSSRNYSYTRNNLEIAGNLLNAINSQFSDRIFFDSVNNSSYYENLNIRYAQFVKFDIDTRFYRNLTNHSMLVYRFWGGIGLPYGNLPVLPFDRSFFAGGTNDIRAWQARSLGPGGLTLNESSQVDQVGDILIEGNVEYRFDISSSLKGALFADAGNIWVLRPDEQRPKANFEFDRFYKEIAIGMGIGLRFDFSFLIIRLDGAFKIKDPGLVSGERWVFQPKTTYREWYPGRVYGAPFRLNLGIGYPF